MKKFINVMMTALLLCALLFAATVIPAKAEEGYGYRVTRNVPNPEIGTQVTITFELTDYDETKSGIRGLQVDLAGLDPQVLEVVSLQSLVADENAAANKAVWLSQEQKIRYLFVKEEGILDHQNKKLFEIVLRINENLSEGGIAELPVICKIQSQDGTHTMESTASIKYREIGAPVEVESIALNKENLQLFTQETLNTEILEVLYTPWDANTGLAVTWSSSDESVATVTDGTVTAVGAGMAVITAETANQSKAECQIQVTGLNKTSLILDLEADEELWVSDGEKELAAVWSSSDESIVTVSEYGKVFAMAEGEAVITAVLEDGTELTCPVQVLNELRSISFRTDREMLESEKTKQLEVIFTPESKSCEVVWETSDENVLTVDNGLVTAVSVGTATVTAKAVTPSGKELKAECVFEVVEKDLTEWVDETFELHAVTNVDSTLADLSGQLPDGWQWIDPSISLADFKGSLSKAFAVWHQNAYTDEILNSAVTVNLTTIDGVVLENLPAKLATGDEPKEVTAEYEYTGIPLTEQEEEALGLTWNIGIAPKAKAGIVDVDSEKEQATLTGIKTGGTKILVQLLAGEKVLAEKQFSISVVDGSKGIAKVQTSLVDGEGNEYVQGSDDAYVIPSGSTIYLKNSTEPGPDGKAYTLTYKSSDTSVLKVGKADKKDKTKVALTAGKPGYVFLTATANDALKTTVKIAVKITDNTAAGISLGKGVVTINQLLENTAAEVMVYNGHDAVLESVEVMKDKAGTIKSDAFSVQIDEENPNKLIITCQSAVKSSTVYLKIRTVGMEGKAAVLPLRVNLVSKAPAITIKQSSKLNTFYKGSYGLISVGASGEVITDVTIKEEDCGYEYDYLTGKVTVKEGGNIANRKCTFMISLEGYSKQIEKKVTISTQTVNAALENTSGTVYSGSKNMSVRTRLLNKKTKEALNLDQAQVTVTDKYGDPVKGILVRTEGDELVITALNAPAKTLSLQLNIRSDEWNESRKCRFSLNVKDMKKAALQLGGKTLTLYNYRYAAGAEGESSTGTVLTLNGKNIAKMLENVVIEGADVKSAQALGKTLRVSYEKETGRIEAGIIGDGPEPGNYKFLIWLDDESLSKVISTSLTVKVVNVNDLSNCVKVGLKGKIDVLNRDGSSITLTPRFKNLTADAEVTDIRLAGPDAHLFEITDNTANVLTVKLREDVNVVTKYNYRVTVVYTAQAGGAVLEVESAPVKVKLTQGKATNSTDSTGAYSNTVSEKRFVRFTVVNSAGETLEIQHVELLNYTEDFVYNEETGELEHRMRGETARGKTYKLKFNIYLTQRGDNEKPITVEYPLLISK